MSATVLVPEELAERIGKLAGEGCLEQFVLEAAEERLRRLELVRAAEAAAGSIKPGMVPEWDTPESTVEWVRQQRVDRPLEGPGDALPPRHFKPD